jgi:LPXTG-motif cell wall-anchored protein
MRMRIATALVLALGLLGTGPVAALAQISDSGQAAEVQYPDIDTREEAAEDTNDLPVTGFVAIPLVVTGLALLLAGGVMHVRTRRED